MNTNTTTTENTPGFNCRMTVWFQTDRNGRRFAMASSGFMGRAARVNMAAAEMWVAQGQADQVTPDQAPTMAAVARSFGR